MEDYTLEDILNECHLLAAQNKTAMKKRERTYLDKRNYLAPDGTFVVSLNEVVSPSN